MNKYKAYTASFQAIEHWYKTHRNQMPTQRELDVFLRAHGHRVPSGIRRHALIVVTALMQPAVLSDPIRTQRVISNLPESVQMRVKPAVQSMLGIIIPERRNMFETQPRIEAARQKKERKVIPLEQTQMARNIQRIFENQIATPVDGATTRLVERLLSAIRGTTLRDQQVQRIRMILEKVPELGRQAAAYEAFATQKRSENAANFRRKMGSDFVSHEPPRPTGYRPPLRRPKRHR